MRLLGALDATAEEAAAPAAPSGPGAAVVGARAPAPMNPNAPPARRTVRQVLEGAAFSGSTAARATLDAARIPDDCVLVFEWWTELHRQRGGSGFGLNPIAWADLDAWMRVTRRTVSPHDVDLILLGDAHYLLGLDKGLPEPAEAAADRPLWGEDGEDLHRPELVALDLDEDEPALPADDDALDDEALGEGDDDGPHFTRR